jgi:hypothetical protein
MRDWRRRHRHCDPRLYGMIGMRDAAASTERPRGQAKGTVALTRRVGG